ncbi:glycosyltransferase involved in cell wall biosynthesis [Novosphingobium sp. PhB57]|uniref:glycosyltransferase n=1 Tax=Novosphingobium sp. PhB57 TaxID=2485107 RepID=UPI001047F3EB|nr:glycosyltransferase [Novosphingobium sp. PhB57]TCU56003.1 glycosyltransferase involved in cell wall biosynthesis [Novosphingobium sp. PhB57]
MKHSVPVAEAPLTGGPALIRGERIALVHDWIPLIAGAERVLQQMAHCTPGSDIFTLFNFLPEEVTREFFGADHRIQTSGLNDLPLVEQYYRFLLLQSTRAIEAFDLTEHDVVLSSSAALAKGVITGPGQLHVSYVHSPARYAWDLTHEYIATVGGTLGGLKRAVAREMMHRFRLWDMRTAQSVDHYLANSQFIARRIWKIYRREAQVIYPPVNTGNFVPGTASRGDHFVTASRLVPYKRVEMIVEAFNRRPDLRLRVIGDGPDMKKIRQIAGSNIEILGHVPFEQLIAEFQTARALVFAALEDFGIVPVEAQACGTPVVCLGKGGTAETVRPLGSSGATGVWFEDQTVESLVGAIDMFVEGEGDIRAEDCIANAASFGEERFRQQYSDCVNSLIS